MTFRLLRPLLAVVLALTAGTALNHVVDGADVGGRAGDVPQNVSCRRLLLEVLGDVGILVLHLGEQADVLDGFRRLVCECLE